MKYENKIIINGEVFTHTIIANNYEEAKKINQKRKEDAAKKGQKVAGRFQKVNEL